MIKINLLPADQVRRRRRTPGAAAAKGGQNLLAVFILIILVELGGLVYWWMETDAAIQGAGAGRDALTQKLNDYKDRIQKGEELKVLEADLARQKRIFGALENGQNGPMNLMLFVSYALRSANSMGEDELQVISNIWTGESRNVAGEGLKPWNPQTVWLTDLEEKRGMVSIRGAAKNHEDVMTFLRRLKSSIYFDGLDLVKQKVKKADDLKQSFVEFELYAELNYDPEGFQPIE